MAAPVYSTRFIAFDSGGTESQSYTVPAGYVAVVVDVTALVGAADDELIQFQLATVSAFLLYENGSSEGYRIAQWSGRAVAPEGEELLASISGSGFSSIQASGYLLAA